MGNSKNELISLILNHNIHNHENVYLKSLHNLYFIRYIYFQLILIIILIQQIQPLIKIKLVMVIIMRIFNTVESTTFHAHCTHIYR